MGLKTLSRYRLHTTLAILLLIVLAHLMMTSPEIQGYNIQVPVTLSLFAEYPPITEPSNNLDDHHDISTVSDEIIEQTFDNKALNNEDIVRENDILISDKQKSRQNNATDFYISEDNIVLAKELIPKDALNDKAKNKSSSLFSYKGKLKLIKDANSAISEMKKYLDKKTVTVDETDDDITDADVDKGDKIAGGPPPLVSGVWQAVKILSEKTGLVTSDEGFINIKPLVNMTVNSLGLFDDTNDEKDKPFDPNDTKTVLRSIFQIWNPRASHWASKTSKRYKAMVRSEGESGDQGYHSRGRVVERTVVEECGCERALVVERDKVGGENGSTCSLASYARGPGQKVVGFSFYGNPNSTKGKERKYFQGIKENLELLPKHYPGWIIRVYYDLPLGHPVLSDLCSLACNNTNLDICYVRNIPSSGDIHKIFAMNWRFFPTLDPQVDAFVSRDLDSRLNSREAAAVSAWYSTPHHFHFMRDHPAHSIEILGSGWGVRLGPPNSKVRQLFRESFHEASHDPMFWAERKAYGPDQGFLKRYIWPWGKWSSLSHDSYSCMQFPRTSPFPSRRKEGENNFIAAVVEAKDILRQECPVGCRPPDHQDWLWC